MKCEIDLIEKAKAGDQDAFEKIVDVYKNDVFAIILNFIKKERICRVFGSD